MVKIHVGNLDDDSEVREALKLAAEGGENFVTTPSAIGGVNYAVSCEGERGEQPETPEQEREYQEYILETK